MAMSMRQRRGGITVYRPQRRVVPPSYEDFQPNSEWIEEDRSTILRINVEGFLKDQIKVDYDVSAGLIRVSGERPILNRRLLRFNEQFSAPEDCNPREMEIQFDGGILWITIPKLNIGPKENAKETLLQEASIEPIPPKDHEDILPKTTSDTDNEQQKPEEKIEAVISVRSSEAENVMEDKEVEIGERSKESKTSAVSVLENKEKEKNESDINLETKKGGGDYEEKPGKVGVSNTGRNEEKQMLINVGVATLVIFTVGAQIYNTIIGFNSPS